MFSQRFQLPVLITRHARQRMAERDVDEILLLDLIETGSARHKDATHLWLIKHYEGRHAAAVIEGALVVKTVLHRFQPEQAAMKTTYFEADDILVLHMADKAIVREVSQDWNTHISYAADGSVVEAVVLDAQANGAMPVYAQAA